jgi:hypothetical protein
VQAITARETHVANAGERHRHFGLGADDVERLANVGFAIGRDKDRARNFAPGDPPQIFDIGDDGHGGTRTCRLGRTHRPLCLELAALAEPPQIRGHHGRHGEGLDAERFERAAFTLGRFRDDGIAAQQLDLVGR